MNENNTILFVGKDFELYNALEKHLSRHGFDVIVQKTGQDALALGFSLAFSVVIVGTELEDITATELIRKTSILFPEVQVIVMADPKDMNSVIECLRLGASDYLCKPVNSDVMLLAIERAYRKKNIDKQLAQYKKEAVIASRKQSLFEQLFDEVPCYISIQDKNFRLTGANKHFKRDFGNKTGSFCYEVYKHRDEPCRYCPVQATFEDGMNHHTEEVVTSQNGQQYNVLTLSAPIRNERGNIIQVMEMSTNITEIRKLQSNLTSLGLLVGSMSHGVRGVLTALDGGIYRLEKGIRADDKLKITNALEIVKSMIHRIQNMVLDILYYTKGRDLNWTKVNILDFAEQINTIVKPKAEKHSVDYLYEPKCSDAFVELDSGTMSSALVNILENSIDACLDDPAKGKSHSVIFRVLADDRQIVFEATDNGIGMDQQTRENIFTLFFSSKNNRGTGLGLFVANQIVEQHGGSIAVESKPGKGSTFRIRLYKTLPADIKNKEKNDIYKTSLLKF